MTENSIHQAVELTKIAVASANGHWISSPEKVTEFIETVARKLQELRDEK